MTDSTGKVCTVAPPWRKGLCTDKQRGITAGQPAQEPPESTSNVEAVGPPPRPLRPSYAALAAATAGSEQPMRELPSPPPRRLESAESSSRPVATSAFFEEPTATVVPALPAGLRGPRPMNTSPSAARPVASYRQAHAGDPPAQTGDDQVSADADVPSSDDDELRLAGNEGYSAPPPVCPTTGRQAIRVYGKAKKSYSSRLAAPPPTAPPPPVVKWDDDEWGNGSDTPSGPLVASTSAARREGVDRGAGAPRDASWEELVHAGYAEQHPQNQQHSSPHFVQARASPPPVVAVPPVDVGGWTTPRVLARTGEYGSKPGIWEYTTYDFDLKDTPAGEPTSDKLRYPAMGTEIREAGRVSDPGATIAATTEPTTDSAMHDSESSQTTAVTTESQASSEDPVEDPDAPEPAPARRPTFRTVTRAELDAVRPHPSLFFCPHTFSWCLFARTKDGDPVPSHDLILWQAKMAGVQEDDIGAWFTENGIGPPPADPIAPANSIEHMPEHASLDDLEGGAVLELVSNYRRVCAFSTQDWYPAVISANDFHNLLDNCGRNPATGYTAADARYQAVRTIWR